MDFVCPSLPMAYVLPSLHEIEAERQRKRLEGRIIEQQTDLLDVETGNLLWSRHEKEFRCHRVKRD